MATRTQSWTGGFGAALVFIVGAAAMAGLASLVRVPAPPPGEALGERIAPALVVARRDRLPAGVEARERLWLFDPAPLFLPAGLGEAEGITRIGGADGGSEATKDFPDALQFPLVAPARGILRPAPTGSPIAAAERLARPRWFDGMAREGAPESSGAVGVRLARLEVYASGGGAMVAARDLTAAEGWPEGEWMPLEFRVLVDAAGAVGGPALETGSGNLATDERIRSIVGRDLLPTLRLRPGIYRLEVGP